MVKNSTRPRLLPLCGRTEQTRADKIDVGCLAPHLQSLDTDIDEHDFWAEQQKPRNSLAATNLSKGIAQSKHESRTEVKEGFLSGFFGCFSDRLCMPSASDATDPYTTNTLDEDTDASHYDPSHASSAPGARLSSCSTETDESSISTTWQEEGVPMMMCHDPDEDYHDARIVQKASVKKENITNTCLPDVPKCEYYREPFDCGTGICSSAVVDDEFVTEPTEEVPPAVVIISPPDVRSIGELSPERSQILPRRFVQVEKVVDPALSASALRAPFYKSGSDSALLRSASPPPLIENIEMTRSAFDRVPRSPRNFNRPVMPMRGRSNSSGSRMFAGPPSVQASVKTEKVRNTTPIISSLFGRQGSGRSCTAKTSTSGRTSSSGKLKEHVSPVALSRVARAKHRKEETNMQLKTIDRQYSSKSLQSIGMVDPPASGSYDRRRYSFPARSPIPSFDEEVDDMSLSGDPVGQSTQQRGRSRIRNGRNAARNFGAPKFKKSLYMYRTSSFESTASDRAHMDIYEMGELLKTIPLKLSELAHAPDSVAAVVVDVKQNDFDDILDPNLGDCLPTFDTQAHLLENTLGASSSSDRYPKSQQLVSDEASVQSLKIKVVINQAKGEESCRDEILSEITPSLMTELSSSSAVLSRNVSKSLKDVLTSVGLLSQERRGAGPIDIDEVSEGWNSVDSRRYSTKWRRECSGAAKEKAATARGGEEESMSTASSNSCARESRLQSDLVSVTREVLEDPEAADTFSTEIAAITTPQYMRRMGSECAGMTRDVQKAGPGVCLKWFG